MVTKEQVIDILEKFDFFQGQRAGRELWNDKPFDVQEKDINNFSRDVSLIKEYISDVAPRTETAREIFAEIEDLFFDKYLLANITASLFEDKYAELKEKYCGKDTNVPTESEVET